MLIDCFMVLYIYISNIEFIVNSLKAQLKNEKYLQTIMFQLNAINLTIYA